MSDADDDDDKDGNGGDDDYFEILSVYTAPTPPAPVFVAGFEPLSAANSLVDGGIADGSRVDCLRRSPSHLTSAAIIVVSDATSMPTRCQIRSVISAIHRRRFVCAAALRFFVWKIC